jgi:hypothetical protein
METAQLIGVGDMSQTGRAPPRRLGQVSTVHYADGGLVGRDSRLQRGDDSGRLI